MNHEDLNKLFEERMKPSEKVDYHSSLTDLIKKGYFACLIKKKPNGDVEQIIYVEPKDVFVKCDKCGCVTNMSEEK